MAWLKTEDFDLWERGEHVHAYRKLGAHPKRGGTWFCVWAPHAERVSVVGDFNGWDGEAHPMNRSAAGLWEVYIRGVGGGHHYKYRIERGSYRSDKTDPYARVLEAPLSDGNPIAGLSSIVHAPGHAWGDQEWMSGRIGPETLTRPVSIYEVHLGSWRRREDGYSMSYREIAGPLADHVEKHGFTHIELMPVQEHPYYASWGYQVVGYFAPTFRYGSPDDLRFLIDTLHQRGIGVLLDWVPAHFATDPQSLVFFDGSTLYEYDDSRMRHHPDWGTFVFDYGKPGVRNFLISNALFWLDEYHIDGLRFDAVASMLYRDYSRSDWTPNRHGGRENLEAIEFLKKTNEAVYTHHPSVLMIAEESTAWPGVSKPTYDGGLGFLYKWNMGWMHDTLEYMKRDPLYRSHHLNDLTFSMVYAYSEHYMLPLSHDEVVHGKGSLFGKMPGDDWQKAANLRLLFGHMWGHPGKKLLFMGGEFGQGREWSHDRELDWFLLDKPIHSGIAAWVTRLNELYRSRPALHNEEPGGFEWIDFSDWQQSVVSYVRRPASAPPSPEGAPNSGTAKGAKSRKAAGHEPDPHADSLVFVLNFTPLVRDDYRVGLPAGGTWRVLASSDEVQFGGSGVATGQVLTAEGIPEHNRPVSAAMTLPPLGVLILERD